MAVTKGKIFESSQKRIAKLTKALGHPARIAILQLLADRQECICGDITNELPLAQSTVSQHLKALKDVGLIKGEIDGVRTCYCLNGEGIVELNDLFSPLVNKLQISIEEQCC